MEKNIGEGIQKIIDFAKLWVSQICGLTTLAYELDWGFFKGNIVDIEESFSNSILHVQIKRHSTFVSLISMVRSQTVNLILATFWGTTPRAHNSKWLMQSHFWYLSYKTLPMILWGLNLDQFYYYIVVQKHLNFHKTTNPKMFLTLKCWGYTSLHFPMIIGLCLNHGTLFQPTVIFMFNLDHEPKIKIITLVKYYVMSWLTSSWSSLPTSFLTPSWMNFIHEYPNFIYCSSIM